MYGGGVDSSDATATSSDILSGKTAYVNDEKIEGTMTNNGTVNKTLSINGSYTIPKGYHDGNGKVTQSIATKSAATITPSTSNQIINSGQYLSGSQTIKGDSNLISSNIKSGVSIFGVNGSLTEGLTQETISIDDFCWGTKIISDRNFFGFKVKKLPIIFKMSSSNIYWIGNHVVVTNGTSFIACASHTSSGNGNYFNYKPSTYSDNSYFKYDNTNNIMYVSTGTSHTEMGFNNTISGGDWKSQTFVTVWY